MILHSRCLDTKLVRADRGNLDRTISGISAMSRRPRRNRSAAFKATVVRNRLRSARPRRNRRGVPSGVCSTPTNFSVFDQPLTRSALTISCVCLCTSAVLSPPGLRVLSLSPCYCIEGGSEGILLPSLVPLVLKKGRQWKKAVSEISWLRPARHLSPIG
jgi:hypothetical protein